MNCQICGQPTQAKGGICARSRKCRAANMRLVRAEAAGQRPEAVPPAPAPRPTRITVDLGQADYRSLTAWAGSADVPGPPRLTLARTLRAMIRATVTDPIVSDVVTDLLRKEQATAGTKTT